MAAMASRWMRSTSAIAASSSSSAPRHHLFAQAAQLGQVRLQFGSQGRCLPLGARDKILFFLNALLGGPDFGLEIF
jgi:hypothetical protein